MDCVASYSNMFKVCDVGASESVNSSTVAKQSCVHFGLVIIKDYEYLPWYIAIALFCLMQLSISLEQYNIVVGTNQYRPYLTKSSNSLHIFFILFNFFTESHDLVHCIYVYILYYNKICKNAALKKNFWLKKARIKVGKVNSPQAILLLYGTYPPK